MGSGLEAPALEAIVLAGGLGTRLREVVQDVPKPLAPVAGRPFLLWLLDALAAGGVRRVVLATGYLGEQMMAATGRTHAGMDIAESREAQALGTGGAIRDALPHTSADRVLVLNGDTFARVDYAAMDRETAGAALAMAVLPVEDRARYGSVHFQDHLVTGFAEKGDGAGPGHINSGVYLIRRDLPQLQQPGAFSFERDVLQAHVDSLRIAAFETPGPFIDIGTPEDFARAQTLLPAWQA